MTDIAIPAVPVGFLLLVNFFAPYASSIVISPIWPAAWKKVVAVAVSVLLTVVVLLIAYFGFKVPLPSWPILVLLGILVSQSAYSLIHKAAADALTTKAGIGTAPAGN